MLKENVIHGCEKRSSLPFTVGWSWWRKKAVMEKEKEREWKRGERDTDKREEERVSSEDAFDLVCFG